MTERIIYLVLILVALSWLASELPRLTLPLTVLGLLTLIGRVVWWYTR